MIKAPVLAAILLACALPATARAQHYLSETVSETNFEIDDAAGMIAAYLRDPAKPQTLGGIDFQLGMAGDAQAKRFPTRLWLVRMQCAPAKGGVMRFVAERYCLNGKERYDQLLLTTYLHWHTVTEHLRQKPFEAYVARTRAFTIAEAEARLAAIGYRPLGVVEGQSSVHGFPTPLVHSAFVRGPDDPAIVVGYRPGPDPAPSVYEIRLFLPARD